MRKWMGYLVLTAVCIGMMGCGKKETGSELLTETKEAVEPVKEAVAPAVVETPEGIALHIYHGDDQAEQIQQRTVYVDEVNEHVVMSRLAEALGMDESVGVKSLTFGMHGGDKVAILDLNQAFADYVSQMGTAGEYIVMGSLTNTFLDCYQCELLIVTVEGRVLETGHSVYEEYLGMYPYVEAPYRVETMTIGEGSMKIDCPQIEGFGDDLIQGKWNRIFLGTEERAMDEWDGTGTYEVTYEVKTMTADVLSILMNGYVYGEDAAHPYAFKYTYNIDLNTGESIRLRDHVDVEKVAENMFAGTGYYVEEDMAPFFMERLEAIYESPDALARSLEGYDYAEDGSVPYGYSYIADGKVWICMEVPHALGDYMEIELDVQ
ncbi:MAG: hypothetical protein KH452_09100 [Clostridiales bacterium]|nr:hypothetical protein [Clostridiales bacterium]